MPPELKPLTALEKLLTPDETKIVPAAINDPFLPPGVPARRSKTRDLKFDLEPAQNPVVTRAVWGASHSKKPLDRRTGPVSSILCTHTEGDYCDASPKCIKLLKKLQTYFIKEKGEVDLPYNFFVGGDGKVYEGRGWSALSVQPKHLPDRFKDGKMLTVAYMGNFNKENREKPSEDMVQARRNLIQFGEERGILQVDRPVVTTLRMKI